MALSGSINLLLRLRKEMIVCQVEQKSVYMSDAKSMAAGIVFLFAVDIGCSHF